MQKVTVHVNDTHKRAIIKNGDMRSCGANLVHNKHFRFRCMSTALGLL